MAKKFDVILIAVGERKVGVIRTVREITGLRIGQSMDLVASAPQPVRLGVSRGARRQLLGGCSREWARRCAYPRPSGRAPRRAGPHLKDKRHLASEVPSAIRAAALPNRPPKQAPEAQKAPDSQTVRRPVRHAGFERQSYEHRIPFPKMRETLGVVDTLAQASGVGFRLVVRSGVPRRASTIAYTTWESSRPASRGFRRHPYASDVADRDGWAHL